MATGASTPGVPSVRPTGPPPGQGRYTNRGVCPPEQPRTGLSSTGAGQASALPVLRAPANPGYLQSPARPGRAMSYLESAPHELSWRFS
jgi:hypothetical protein